MKKIILLMILLALSVIHATVYFVDSTHGSDAYGGTELAPWEHISYAISQASAGDTLMLSGTFYLGQDSGTTENGIEITKDLTFIGEGAKNTFVKAALNPGTASTRVFQVNIGITAEIRSLSVQNGVGINGGGIFNRGSLTLEYVNVSSNECTASGGGINSTGPLTVRNSCISGNTSVLQGGGILASYRASAAFEIENSTVSGNSASDNNGAGGGISLAVNATARNVTLTALINSCTIADNSTGKGTAKGLYIYTSEELFNNATANLNVSNTIISNGTSGNYAKDTSDGGTVSLTRSFSICSDESMSSSGEGNLNSTDPLLDSLADNGGQTMTHATLWESPAIEAISIDDGTEDYNGAPLTDQRGIAINRYKKDIGSYEYDGIGVYYFNSETGDDTNGDGSSSNPWLNLGRGLNAGVEGDILDLTGTFYMDNDPYVNEVVANGYVIGQAGKNRIIQGQGADQTVIKGCPDGQQAESNIFLVLDGYSLTLRDISLANGYDDYNGGGIQSRSELILDRVMIYNCTAPNNLHHGGAIYHTGSLLEITDSTIYDNSAGYWGGGIAISVLEESSTVNITNSTFSNNSAVSGGGAIHATSSSNDENAPALLTININSCTFKNNIDNSHTGNFLVHNKIGLYSEINTSIDNCIITGEAPNYSGYPSQLNRNYTINSDASLFISGTGNLNDVECLLDELKDNGGGTLTCALMEGSPAIDAIPIGAGSEDYNGAPLLDQRGVYIVNSNKDMGAYEGSIPYYLQAPELYDCEWNSYIYWMQWYVVERATNYAVYSSTEPYGTFDLEWVGADNQTNWDKTVDFDRSWFFTVTAVDTTHSKGGIPKTIEIKRP
jgi:predicted outer membrane repeat protein